MKNINKFFKNNRLYQYLPIILVLSISSTVYSASMPYTFTAGTSAKSSEVNENFSYLANRSWELSNNNLYYNNGNVGIGITNPDGKLEVGGRLYICETHQHLSFKESDNNDFTWDLEVNDSNFRINQRNSGVTCLEIDSTGNVGIGKINPAEKLEVVGTVKANNFVGDSLEVYLDAIGKKFPIYGHKKGYNVGDHYSGLLRVQMEKNQNDIYPGGIVVEVGNITQDPSIDDTTDNFVHISSLCGPLVLQVGDGGNVGIGTTSPSYKLQVAGTAAGTSWTNLSDSRLKKNVTTIDNALNKVSALRGVEFEWRKDEFPEKNFEKGTKVGLIAQEVEKVLPLVVSTDNEGYKSVEYANIVAVLIEAIKELKEQNKKLLTRIEALESR